MKSLKKFTKVFIHRDPVDMRKQINGLSVLVESARMGSLMEPHLFIFMGRKRDSIKILYFDRSGFALWQKRLEEAKFIWPRKHTESVVQISPDQLAWLLDGYDVWKMRPFENLFYERVS
jgi:transposase